MFVLEVTSVIEKQFKTLEDRARSGTLSENNKDLLAKIYHCLLNLSVNPQYPSLKTTPYPPLNKWLSKLVGVKVKCFHSYIENNTSGAKRIYWYYVTGKIRLVGIAKHPKEGSKELPKFKDLAEIFLHLVSS